MTAKRGTFAFLALALASGALAAQNVDTFNLDGRERLALLPVPVTKADITDHPYRVIDVIEVSITKATIVSKNPTKLALAEKLWEAAQKLGADAVVNVEFDQSERGGWAYGKRKARGQAIKFLTEIEAENWRAKNSTSH